MADKPTKHDHVGHMVYGLQKAYCRKCSSRWWRTVDGPWRGWSA